jgi:hypothetical protein
VKGGFSGGDGSTSEVDGTVESGRLMELVVVCADEGVGNFPDCSGVFIESGGVVPEGKIASLVELVEDVTRGVIVTVLRSDGVIPGGKVGELKAEMASGVVGGGATTRGDRSWPGKPALKYIIRKVTIATATAAGAQNKGSFQK